MANCNGNAGNQPCGGIVYKCEKCGSVGCKSRINGIWCSNVLSQTGMCNKCNGRIKQL